MKASGQIETGGETLLVEGILNSDLRIGALPGGSAFATCTWICAMRGWAPLEDQLLRDQVIASSRGFLDLMPENPTE